MKNFNKEGKGMAFGQTDKVRFLCRTYFRIQCSADGLRLSALSQKLFRYSGTSTIITILFFVLFSNAQGQSVHTLFGEVRSAANGLPIEGATISIDKNFTRSNKDGKFTLIVHKEIGELRVKHIGFRDKNVSYDHKTKKVHILLTPVEKEIEEVEVSTGYQRLPKERATGSFEFVDSALFNRKVSTDFVSRLEDVIPGLSSNKVFSNNQRKGSLMNINVRGISTLRSEKWPLIVIDGIPYVNKLSESGYGMFNNINPDDIENITILKDAAAASVWGAQSGNGVIVITTKRGKYNEISKLSFNTSQSYAAKPDLYYLNQMSTSDYIDLQKLLFDSGRYTNSLQNWSSNPQPLLWLMKSHKDGEISETNFIEELERLKSIDSRDDFLKYVYRPTIKQQYHVQFQSGSSKMNNLTAVGYNKTLENIVKSASDRLTLKSSSQFRPISNLSIETVISYVESKSTEVADPIAFNQLGAGEGNYPYLQLADKEGNPLVVEIPTFSKSFRETVAGGRLLNWEYSPLAEIDDSRLTYKVKEMMFHVTGSYTLPFGLKVLGMYAYQQANNPVETWRGMGSFYQRDLLNSHTSWDANQVTWHIPVGDYLSISHWLNHTHQLRINTEFNRKWNGKNELNVLGGYEIREAIRKMTYSQYYGYDPETGTHRSVRYGMEVPFLNGMAGVNRIIDRNRYESFSNRFISYYANGAYTYNNRYLLSSSLRKDASNLFGVSANDRGQPFWSVGGAWIVSNENFIQNNSIHLLKLRATFGYNGNMNNTVSGFPIISIQSSPNSLTGQNFATMTTPPNPSLRWERVGNLNIGLDFNLLNGRLFGSIENYKKMPKDLISHTEVDPTTGFTTLLINSANLHTNGWDISLGGIPLRGREWQWNTNVIMSYSRTTVMKSYLAQNIASSFVSEGQSHLMTPIEGMDLYSLLTYKWAGLDPNTGESRAYFNGEVSKDYIAIVNADVSSLENHGSMVPLYFGSLRNGITYKNFEISCNIAFQLGSKFLRPSFSNETFLSYGAGHADYAKRWQKVGDELYTDVPAFTYPNNMYGSQVYLGSSALVEDGSFFKIRDIQMSVKLPNIIHGKLKDCRVYMYAQNLGFIWKGNKSGIDPEYGRAIPESKMIALGLNFNI